MAKHTRIEEGKERFGQREAYTYFWMEIYDDCSDSCRYTLIHRSCRLCGKLTREERFNLKLTREERFNLEWKAIRVGARVIVKLPNGTWDIDSADIIKSKWWNGENKRIEYLMHDRGDSTFFSKDNIAYVHPPVIHMKRIRAVQKKLCSYNNPGKKEERVINHHHVTYADGFVGAHWHNKQFYTRFT